MNAKNLKKEYLSKGVNIDDDKELSSEIKYLEKVLEEQEELEEDIYPEIIKDNKKEISEAIDYLYENGFCDKKRSIFIKRCLFSSSDFIINIGFKMLDKIIVSSGDFEYTERQKMIELVKEVKFIVGNINEYRQGAVLTFMDNARKEIELEKLKKYKNKKGK